MANADIPSSRDHSTRPQGAVVGRDPRPIDRELALINRDVYEETGSQVAGWRPVSDEALRRLGLEPHDFVDQDSGFLARLYVNEDGRYVLALRGTNEGRDWRSNVRQGVGLKDEQYNLAVTVAESVRGALGDRFMITGHSLGGGLAAIAALKVNAPAVTFNAAGVHDNTFERNDIDPDAARAHAAESGQIRRYTVDNEILTRLQEHSLPLRYALPDAVGHRIRLPDPDPPGLLERLSPLHSLRHGVDVHSMDAVIRALDLQQQRTTPVPAPRHDLGLLDETLRGMRGLPHERLAIGDGHAYLNAAAFVAASARDGGLRHVDHVVASADGRRLFAVEGRLDDPGHRRIPIDLAQATSIPMERSAAVFESAAAREPPAMRLADEPRLRPLAI